MASRDDGPAGLAAADDKDAAERQAGAGGDPPGCLQPAGQGEQREAVADCARLGHVPDLGDDAGIGQAQAAAAQRGASVEQRVVELAQMPAGVVRPGAAPTETQSNFRV